jgi:hypothetical protein
MDATAHLEALAGAYEAAMTEVGRAAQAAHDRVDNDLAGLNEVAAAGARPAPFADVPFDEPQPYVPSSGAYNAAIPDTPLVDSPLSNASLAFDDAPLWQS